MQKLRAFFAFQALLLVVPLLFSNPVEAQDNSTFSAQLTGGDVRALAESALAFRAFGQGPRVTLRLNSDQGPVVLSLQPDDIRGPNFISEVTAPDGTHSDPTHVDLFSGTVDSKNGSDFSRLALITDVNGKTSLSGFFQYQSAFYSFSSDKAAPEAVEVRLLSAQQLKDILAHCGVELSSSQHASSGMLLDGSLYEVSATLKQAEIATEADYEYFQAHGNNADSANANILSILNGVAGIYQSQLGVTFSVVYQHAWTTSGDPYSGTSSDSLLIQFQNYWESNVRSAHPYDVAHLWTGRDLDSNIVGLAYISAVCSSYGYGLSQDLGSPVYDVPLAAHEIGHNFGANHDVCNSSTSYIMCPSLVANASTFSPTSVTAIRSFLNSASCLSSVDEPPGDPGSPQHPPVLTPIGAKTISEYQTLSITLSGSDEDGGSLNYSFTPNRAGMSLNGTSFSYTPPGDTVSGGAASAAVNVTFTVTDSSGLSDSETVVITVNSNNLPPSFTAPGSRSTSQGTVFSYSFDAHDPDGDSLTYAAFSGLPPGAVLDPVSGLLRWKPAGNQSGNFAIVVRATDTYGASTQTTLTLSVGAVDGVPPLPAKHALPDFDGDGRADVAVFRSTTGEWFSKGMLASAAAGYSVKQWGLAQDLPVPGDYNADRITDYAVYRPSTQTWYLNYSGIGESPGIGFGVSGDIPAPGDYDGDGRWDIAVFRPSVGALFYRRSSDGSTGTFANIGISGDIPVPCDYDGDGTFDPAVYRPASGQWLIQKSAGGSAVIALGDAADLPQPADYNGDGRCEPAVWRPSNGSWYLPDAAGVQFGLGEDVPAAADYDGDGKADFEVFRPSIAYWFFRHGDGSATLQQLGLPSDIIPLTERYFLAARNSSGSNGSALGIDNRAVSLYNRSLQTLTSVTPSSRIVTTPPAGAGSYILTADYDGDGNPDTAVYGAGLWVIYQSFAGVRAQFWGRSGDIPVSGDFDGDGKADITVFRPNDNGIFSAWYAILSSNGSGKVYSWGLSGDMPLPADYNGDGVTDPAVWRPSDGVWYVQSGRSSQLLQAVQWGLPGDIPRAADFDGDGRADKVIWRPAQGNWFVNYSSGAPASLRQWGLPGDVPLPGRYISSTTADYAVYRPKNSTVYVLSNTGATVSITTGLGSEAQPVGYQPADPLR
jgi:hypothetical protein